ncbi:MAG: hypothetical protein LAN84_02030 [Acidobacteriia bacterium]|nr:hypothetical protein [Terriglobia bacterium]
MEILLNSAWLVLALAFTAVWYARWLPVLRERGAGQHSFYALALVLVLLFPVISLTDDLHADVLVAMPETKSSRTLLLNGHAAHTVHGTPCAPQATDGLAAAPRSRESLAFCEFLAALKVFSPVSALHRPTEGRAPPVRS